MTIDDNTITGPQADTRLEQTSEREQLAGLNLVEEGGEEVEGREEAAHGESRRVREEEVTTTRERRVQDPDNQTAVNLIGGGEEELAVQEVEEVVQVEEVASPGADRFAELVEAKVRL